MRCHGRVSTRDLLASCCHKLFELWWFWVWSIQCVFVRYLRIQAVCNTLLHFHSLFFDRYHGESVNLWLNRRVMDAVLVSPAWWIHVCSSWLSLCATNWAWMLLFTNGWTWLSHVSWVSESYFYATGLKDSPNPRSSAVEIYGRILISWDKIR